MENNKIIFYGLDCFWNRKYFYKTGFIFLSNNNLLKFF